MKTIVHEVHRRSLWQVLGIYLAGSWVVLQVVDQLVESAGLPEWVPSLALVLLLVGLPMVLATAFVQEGMPGQEPGGEPAAKRPPPGDDPAPPASPGRHSMPPQAHGWLRSNVFTWKNALGGSVASLAVFGAATAVWMVLRTAGVGAAGTLVARGLIESGDRVVLAEFSGDSALAQAATMAVRVQLAESGIVSVAEPSLVQSVLHRMEVDGGPVDLARAREVAEREGFKAVVGGSVAGAGGRYIITARVIETASGNELVSVGETARDSVDFLGAIDRLGRRLRERLGESLGSIRKAKPLERVTTSSTEALRKLSRAQDAADARDEDQAIALLDDAIALDSTFAMAWRKLAVVDPERRKMAATRAYELRDRLTERERYQTIGLYHTYVTGNQEEAVTAYRALLETYPDDVGALNNLGLLYHDQGQLALAADMVGRALETDPYVGLFYDNLIRALYEVGRVDSAMTVLGAFAERFPDHRDVALRRADFAYADGDVAGMEAIVQPLLSNAIPSVRRNAMWVISFLRVREGRLREHIELWLGLHENAPDALGKAVRESGLDIDVRLDTVGARARVLDALTTASDSSVDNIAGELSNRFYLTGDAKRGDQYYQRSLVVDSVRWRNMTELDKHLAESWRLYARSCGRGDYENALRHARDIEAALARKNRGADPANWADVAIPAFEGLGLADSVIARYETWLGRRALQRLHADNRILPRAYERLGQLYEERGELEKAAVYYAKFVELWENADPDLQPRVKAARSRLQEIVRARG
ncbi:MAG: tetratricopeptide repeat protein [Gemmatimonadales bacterium]|jgi:tetratricopeptide (TPR) repeat protein